ncbi:MAG: hypothetical protein ACFCU9_16430 [Cyanophyceae cyanobacterium]
MTPFQPDGSLVWRTPMQERESILFTVIQGLGLNMSGLALLASAGFALGPVALTGTILAIIVKLIGDSQLVRAYWLWQAIENDGIPRDM